MKQHSLRKLLSTLTHAFNQWTTPAGITRENGLRYWQERVVLTILLTGLVLGLFAYIPSIRLCIKERLWTVAFVDTLIYAVILILFFVRRIPFAIRANIIILAAFFLGLILLGVVGPSASGPVWIFAFPILAGLIVGVRASIAALVINFITLIGAGILIYIEFPPWLAPVPHTLERWIAITFNFILLNAVSVLSVSMVLRGLQSSLEEETEVRLSLERQIRQRTEAEKTSRENERRLQAIMDHSPALISIKDLDGTIVLANRNFAVLDLPPLEAFVGKNIFDLFPENVARALWENDLAALKSKQPVEAEESMRHKDGTWHTYLTVKFPVYGDDKNPFGICAISTDITERKVMEKNKLEMEAQLRQQQKLESIGTLAGGVAHEINNPINGIMNYAQLIIDRMGENSPLREYCDEIIVETERVANIVRSLLMFARQEKESHSFARVYDIVESVISLIKAVVRRDQITVRVDVSQDLPKIKCRSQQIQQVIMNLVTNARDALNKKFPAFDENKTIHIRAKLFEKNRKEWIRISVEDCGVGILPEEEDRLFDPFFTTKGRDAGTGLGLSISYGIVREHLGDISFESRPGQYSKFFVDLPVNNGWEAEGTKTPDPAENKIENTDHRSV